jgi:putative ABC transport system permease protein
VRAILGRARSEVRRRPVQSLVIVVMVALASGTLTLGLNLLEESGGPYMRALDAQQGAHLKVSYDTGTVTPATLASTPATIGASSFGGPWPDVKVTLLNREAGPAQSRYQLDLVGRDNPQAAAETLNLTSGRWVQAPGEVVISRAFAEEAGVQLGDHLVSLHTADMPVLIVVGEVIDIDQRKTPRRAWVLPAQVADLAGDNGLGYQMAYRFPYDPSKAQLSDDLARLQASLPAGAVSGSANYLAMRDAYNLTNQLLLVLLIAFGLFALVASLATIVNLVLGTIVASYREIGIIKALGFTPLQVVATMVVGTLIPALAGCAIGITAGTALSLPLVNRAARGLDLPATSAVSPLADLLALVSILGCVVAASALAALRAGRLSTVRAISDGGAPSPRAWRLSGWLERLRLPRPLSLGVADAFARPVRGGLTVLAVLVGVSTIVFAAGLSQVLAWYLPANARLDADLTVARESAVSDGRVMAILTDQPQTQQVLAVGHGQVLFPGLAEPVDGLALRGDPVSLGWSTFLVRGRWLGPQPGEVLLPRTVLDQAHLDVGSYVDGIIAGRSLRLHVVGEVTALSVGALLSWSTFTTAVPDAQPDRYTIQLRPGSDADVYAATVQASEPDFLTVTVNRSGSNSTIDIVSTMMRILALVLGLVAAVGVLSTMLLHVRERSYDHAILRAVGMAPRQLLTMVMTTSGVLGVIGGLIGIPAGVLTYRWLLTGLARGIGNDLPPAAFDVLHPATLYPLGLTGLAIALAGAFLPARRAARSRIVDILRSE